MINQTLHRINRNLQNVQIRHEDHQCPICNGTGNKPNGEACPVCHGSGQVHESVIQNFSSFKRDLESLINRYSKENGSNTPDFILAQYLENCLEAWNRSTRDREKWYSRNPRRLA